ncbi:MAG TPA: beta-propeller fold lactonase family protein [Pyrinomonadaceae bacterium]|jgi:YVTN family beta-propeller protein
MPTKHRSLIVCCFHLACLTLLCSASTLDTFAQAKPRLLALNKQESTLAIIDPQEMKVLAKVQTGDNPHEIVVSADGRTAFVSNYGAQTPGSSLSVIDLETRKEIRRVDLSPLFRPHGLVLASGGKVYFTAEVNRLIGRYDPAANKVDWLMGTGQNATHMLVVAPDQKRMYTANIASDSVTAFEFQAQPPAPSKVTHISVGKQPEAIDLSPDGKELWVGQNGDGSISIIDTATNKVKETLRIGEVPIRVKFTPDGKRVLVSDPKAGDFIVLDAATRKELKRLKIGNAPIGIVVTPDSKRAFIATAEANGVAAIDLEKMEITGRVETGQAPDGLAFAGN